MKDHDYLIENLSSVFSQHAEIYEKNQKQMIELYKQNNPDQELPDHFKDTFNLSKALSVMCDEIQKLNESVM